MKIQKDEKKLKDINQTMKKLRKTNPLIHCITNYITINDCANAVLAIGASPAMANEAGEMEDFVSFAGATEINMGSPLENKIEPMLLAAQTAKKTGTPLTLDPVAVGVTTLRNKAAKQLIDTSAVSLIRGNMSEIKAIGNLYNITETHTKAKGVDVADEDIITKNNIIPAARMIQQTAAHLNTTIAVSGPTDIITDSNHIYIIENGDPMMTRITGTGCMLSAMMGAYTAVSKPLDAALTATLVMGIAGQIAQRKTLINNQATGSFRVHLIDELSKMTPETINKYAKLYKITGVNKKI